MCLSVLFLHLGLFLPATHAEVYPVSELFYFSHDHQNLAQGLSSFASESKYYLSLLTQLSDKTSSLLTRYLTQLPLKRHQRWQLLF